METYFVTLHTELLQYITPFVNWVACLQVVVIIIVFYALKGIYLFSVLRALGRYRSPVSYVSGKSSRILIAGDSTAVGTGAQDAEHTIAGFLARDFPHTDIINMGVNGARTSAVIDQLAGAGDIPFDMIIISTGGNDVWAFTRLKKLRSHFTTILRTAKRMSDHHVIVLFFGNEGSAPFFPFFLRRLIMHRTDSVRQVFSEIAYIEQVPLIELFSEPNENPFVRDPKTYFAQDGLHPNDLGYWEWYKHLWRLMVHKSHLYNERSETSLNS